jgi:Ca2+-binding RTX toxin-like protein
MRRAMLLLTVIAVMLVVGAGVALAVSKTGTNQADNLTGSVNPDKLSGGGGNDTIDGKQGNDFLFGDHGNRDTLIGGADPDFINSADGVGGDQVTASSPTTLPGDVCVVDEGDQINSNTVPDNHPQGTALGSCEEVYVVPNP